jgi:hypothetical protein
MFGIQTVQVPYSKSIEDAQFTKKWLKTHSHQERKCAKVLNLTMLKTLQLKNEVNLSVALSRGPPIEGLLKRLISGDASDE